MKVKDIISAANSRADEQYPDPVVQQWVNQSLHMLNNETGLIVPSIPMHNITADLDYDLTFTQKLGNVDPNDPDYIAKQAYVDAHNKKMANIDDIINTQVIVVGTTYLMKVNDGSQFEFQNEKENWMNAISDVRNQYFYYIAPEYKLENIVGSPWKGGSIVMSKKFQVPTYGSTPNSRYRDKNKWGIK